MVIVMAIATNWTYREHQSNGLYWKLWPIYCPFDFLHKWGRIQIIVLNKTKNIINNNNKQHSNIFASLSPVRRIWWSFINIQYLWWMVYILSIAQHTIDYNFRCIYWTTQNKYGLRCLCLFWKRKKKHSTGFQSAFHNNNPSVIRCMIYCSCVWSNWGIYPH